MKRTFFIKCLFIYFIVFWGAAFAENKPKITLAKKEHDVLMSAQKAVKDNELDQAIEILLGFNKGSASKMAKSLSQQLLGSIYQTKEDYPNALKAYETALSYNKLPLSTKVSLFEKAHKLSYFVKDWKKTVSWWLKWEKRVKPNAEDYLLLSSAYKHQENWKKAKQALLKAIALKDPVPKVWQETLLSYEEKLGKPKEQIALLVKMLELYPDIEEYWLKLADLYMRNNQPEKANALLFSAFSQGVLTKEHHIYSLADSLAVNDSPMLASQLLQESIALKYIVPTRSTNQSIVNLLMEAKAYQEALSILNEQDVFDLAIEAEKNKYYQLLAMLHFNLKQWQSAYDAAIAITHQELKFDQQNQLLLGLSSAYMHKSDIAHEHFNTVLEAEPSNEMALYWKKRLNLETN